MGLLGMFPYSAIDLGTFEYLKRRVTTRNARLRGCLEEDSDAAPGAVTIATIGGFSGALGASLVYPLNLLRTRLQTQGTAIHPRTYIGFMDVTRQTIEGEGFLGLFRGLTPNLLKVVPAVSIVKALHVVNALHPLILTTTDLCCLRKFEKGTRSHITLPCYIGIDNPVNVWGS